MVFKNRCVIVLWMKVALALEGLCTAIVWIDTGLRIDMATCVRYVNPPSAKASFVQSTRMQIFLKTI